MGSLRSMFWVWNTLKFCPKFSLPFNCRSVLAPYWVPNQKTLRWTVLSNRPTRFYFSTMYFRKNTLSRSYTWPRDSLNSKRGVAFVSRTITISWLSIGSKTWGTPLDAGCSISKPHWKISLKSVSFSFYSTQGPRIKHVLKNSCSWSSRLTIPILWRDSSTDNAAPWKINTGLFLLQFVQFYDYLVLWLESTFFRQYYDIAFICARNLM